MNKRVRVEYSRKQVAVLLEVSSKELVRQIHRHITDPILVEIVTKAAKAREQFNSIPEEKKA